MEHKIDHELGEMSLTLGERRFHLRLEHQGLRELERQLGENESELAVRLWAANAGSRRIASIIGVLSGSDDIGEIQDAVLKEGLDNVNEPLREYFMLAIRGFRPPEKPSKKKKAKARRGTRSAG